jgi:hypothetical protein
MFLWFVLIRTVRRYSAVQVAMPILGSVERTLRRLLATIISRMTLLAVHTTAVSDQLRMRLARALLLFNYGPTQH